MAQGVSRRRQREARWRRVIREQRRSGLSIREFCRRGKLTERSFYYWRRELRRREAVAPRRHVADSRRPASPGPAMPAFVSVHVEGAGPSCVGGRIEVDVPGGRRIRVMGPIDRQALADVLAVLRFDELAALSAVGGEGRPSSPKASEDRRC